MELSEIRIKNVKGFNENAAPIKFTSGLKPGKINLLVAPNGFGKSSITAAFDSLKSSKLNVNKANKYKQDDTIESELTIKTADSEFIANETVNQINNIFNVSVIHSDIFPKTVTHKMGDYSKSTGFIGIKNIDVCNIPLNVKLKYSIKEERNAFGKNGKLLRNMESVFNNVLFLQKITDEIFETLGKIEKGKRIQADIQEVKLYLNRKTGTSDKIYNEVENSIFDKIKSNEHYDRVVKALCETKSDLDDFLDFFQICSFFDKNRKSGIKSFIEYQKYLNFRTELDKNITYVNSSIWKSIKTSENNNKVIIEFPNADVLSNGQRDIITFTVHLQIVKSKLLKNKSNILLIDEVFDYLDDANILAAQYYLSDLLKYAKKEKIELIIGIFTHLSPKYFRSNAINKFINECYLKDVEAKADEAMKLFIAFREDLYEKNGAGTLIGDDKDLYENLSKYHFHYHPKTIDLKSILTTKKLGKKNVKASWGDSIVFISYLLENLNKYLSENPVYDPYAVSLAIRIGTEKKVYDSFLDENDKSDFLSNKGTKDKMNFAETKGIIVPDAFYILSLIHGESDHIGLIQDKNEFKETEIVYTLDNKVLRHMIEELFDYKSGNQVPIDKLH